MSALATALDPTRLLTAGGLEPDPWQRDLLLKPWDRALLNITRQGGKSTTVAAVALHTALYRKNALVLILAPARRQSKELLTKIWGLYRDMGRPVRVDNRSALRVRFDNGSRIIALPGTEKTVRGFSSVDLIVSDEAARVPDELYEAVRPMLAVSGGRLIGMSTPWGKRGWFYEAWTDKTQDWHQVEVTGHDCPRMTEEFLEQERRELGEWRFAQEYECRFLDTENQFFSTENINSALSAEIDPLFGGEGGSDLLTDTDPLTVDTDGNG